MLPSAAAEADGNVLKFWPDHATRTKFNPFNSCSDIALKTTNGNLMFRGEEDKNHLKYSSLVQKNPRKWLLFMFSMGFTCLSVWLDARCCSALQEGTFFLPLHILMLTATHLTLIRDLWSVASGSLRAATLKFFNPLHSSMSICRLFCLTLRPLYRAWQLTDVFLVSNFKSKVKFPPPPLPHSFSSDPTLWVTWQSPLTVLIPCAVLKNYKLTCLLKVTALRHTMLEQLASPCELNDDECTPDEHQSNRWE